MQSMFVLLLLFFSVQHNATIHGFAIHGEIRARILDNVPVLRYGGMALGLNQDQKDDTSEKSLVNLFHRYSLVLDRLLEDWSELYAALNELSVLENKQEMPQNEKVRLQEEQLKIKLQFEACRMLQESATQLLASATALHVSVLSLDVFGKSPDELRECLGRCNQRICEARDEREKLEYLQKQTTKSIQTHEKLMCLPDISKEQKRKVQSKLEELGHLQANLKERDRQLFLLLVDRFYEEQRIIEEQLKQLEVSEIRLKSEKS
jgi:hypothetical protein